MEVKRLPWRRQPRAPLPAIVGLRFWIFAAFFDAVAMLAAFGTIVGDQPRWAKVVAGLVGAALVAATVLVILHIKRPVAEQIESDPVDDVLITRWRAQLAKATQSTST